MQLIDLRAQQERIQDKIHARIKTVLDHGCFIMGPEVKELENALSNFFSAKHCITCANGTDALQLALMALGVKTGDAVFVPAFTFAATAEVVPMLGAVPFFVDIDPFTFNMSSESLERSIQSAKDLGLNPNTVIPVDMFGLPADYDELVGVARDNRLKVIADSAQGFGSNYKNKRLGDLVDVITTSFFPAKPLGCYGDGGALFTDNDDYANIIESLRVHGKGREKYENVRIGLNSRLDTLQAAILLEKLAIFRDEVRARNDIARRYTSMLSTIVETPHIPEGLQSVWAQYTIKLKDCAARDGLMKFLKKKSIPSSVYYPRSLNRQEAFKKYPTDPVGCPVSESLTKRVLSVPMHPYLEHSSQVMVANAIKSFF